MYHYVIVRADLPIGFAAAQILHAAGESAVGGQVRDGTNAVVLAVPDEPALRAIFARLDEKGLQPFLICEPDAPYNGQATAIGLRPRAGRLACLSSLPLYGAPPRAAKPRSDVYRCSCGELISTAPGAYCYPCNGGLRRRREEKTTTGA